MTQTLLRNLLFTLVAALLSVPALAQLQGLVLEETSRRPVANVNVYVENAVFGATTSPSGTFDIREFVPGNALVINDAAYELSRTVASGTTTTILLKQKIYSFKSWRESNPAKAETVFLNQLPKKSAEGYRCGNTPGMMARYFENTTELKATKEIRKVSILTTARNGKSSFGLRLIAANSDGTPGKDLIYQAIAVTPKKGQDTVTIDLSEFNLQLPKYGVFVAMEWMITEQNYTVETKTEKIKKSKDLKLTTINYDPVFNATVQDYGPVTTWRYSGGNWKPVDTLKRYKPEFLDLDVQLVVSN
ncbi:MAG: hypothetical protein V4616_09200 [Bacteroidota bacterium]